jgi:hypothetical protein
LLADYRAYARAFSELKGNALREEAINQHDFKVVNGLGILIVSPPPLSINHVWLRTTNDSAALARTSEALLRTDVTRLADRRALYLGMQRDPLGLNLVGTLLLGTTTALMLALVGSLFASWLNARTRLTSFAILRALGTDPRQVVSVLAWEQVIVYVTALLLGLIFGALITLTVVPSLTVASMPITSSSVDDITRFYALQQVIPTKIVISPLLGVSFAALVLICMGALGLMVLVVSRPSMGAVLRVSED